MGEFQQIGFKGSELSALKAVANFKQVMHLSDIVCCDRVTVNNWALTSDPGKSTHIFPHKRPRPSDFTLWKDAIHVLTHGELHLPQTLGAFLWPPHVKYGWKTNEAANELFCN